MPKTHASNSFVWSAWNNETGWGSGFAFLAGVLNGAFTIGTPDAVTHMAEEVPHPRKDLPKAIAAQIILGSISKIPIIIVHRVYSSTLTRKSRICLRNRPILWNHRPRRGPKQQRLLSPRGSLRPSHRQQRSNIRPPLHHLPVPCPLPHWNLPHCRPNVVGPCTRRRRSILRVLFPGQRKSQLPDPRYRLYRTHDYCVRRNHAW